MLVDAEALKAVRAHELELIASRLPPGGRVLELGGGAGWQARALSERGFAVASVDVQGNPYRGMAVWPVVTYDGENLPFANDTFDAVFSSNVLEHVPDVTLLLRDCARVVKPGGVAVHLMPSSAWRFWTTVAHYPWLARQLFGRSRSGVRGALEARAGRGKWQLLGRVLFAHRHGEHGTAISELWRFSARHWRRRLSVRGWRVVEDESVRVLYTGYFTSWPWVGIRGRRFLSRFLGGGCRLYMMRRT